jgi:hypothetical protein
MMVTLQKLESVFVLTIGGIELETALHRSQSHNSKAEYSPDYMNNLVECRKKAFCVHLPGCMHRYLYRSTHVRKPLCAHMR